MGIVLSKKLYQSQPGDIGFLCPACKTMHFFYTKDYPHPGPKWDFDGNVESPTVYPSLLLSTNIPRNDAEREVPVTYTECHFFIRNGMIEYCSDSPHSLAGQTVPIPDHNRQPVDDEE